MAVYAKQYGRTGNNLFQKAAAIGYAKKHGLKYDLCAWFASGWASNTGSRRILIKEKGHHYQELPTYKVRNGIPTVLDGYWQSERYFAHCREEVLKVFGYKWEMIHGMCSIHVRRGDYLLYPDKHPVVPLEYIIEAIDTILQKTGTRSYLIFSDDPQWCKVVLCNAIQDTFLNNVYCHVVPPNENADSDLIWMSSCAHNIIANSSFSWWAAWLNQNPDKVVVSPSKDNWFGPGNSHLDTRDLIPDSWIQIKY